MNTAQDDLFHGKSSENMEDSKVAPNRKHLNSSINTWSTVWKKEDDHPMTTLTTDGLRLTHELGKPFDHGGITRAKQNPHIFSPSSDHGRCSHAKRNRVAGEDVPHVAVCDVHHIHPYSSIFHLRFLD